jgi:hypothetical protein
MIISQPDHNRRRNTVFSVGSTIEAAVDHLEITVIAKKEEATTRQL